MALKGPKTLARMLKAPLFEDTMTDSSPTSTRAPSFSPPSQRARYSAASRAPSFSPPSQRARYSAASPRSSMSSGSGAPLGDFFFYSDVENCAGVEGYLPCEPYSSSEPGGLGLRGKYAWSLARGLLPLCCAALLGAIAGAALVLCAGTGEQAPPQPYTIQRPATEVPASYMATPGFNNSDLIPRLQTPDGPQTLDACKFVIESTDEVWNKRGNVEAALDKYFHAGYLNAGSWGRRGVGISELKQGVYSEMRAFPDIRIHITDCSCKGNDLDGYKCFMSDVLDGTNTGPSAWGPATNRYARWTGLIESFVRRDAATGQWQYVAEWGVHDEWALIAQLGLDFAKVPHPPTNTEPIHDGEPLLRLGQTVALDREDAAIQSSKEWD